MQAVLLSKIERKKVAFLPPSFPIFLYSHEDAQIIDRFGFGIGPTQARFLPFTPFLLGQRDKNNGSEPESAMFQPVPGSHIVRRPFASAQFPQAMQPFQDPDPDRARLSYAATIFMSAWKSPFFSRVVPCPKATVPDWKYVSFKHESTRYRFAVNTLCHLAIKLPNHGFLYLPEKSLSVNEASATAGVSHFVRVAPSELDDPFKDVWSFADWFLGDSKWTSGLLQPETREDGH